MLAALALSESRFYLLIDDDTTVRLPLAASFASLYGGLDGERHAFGPYLCMDTRRADPALAWLVEETPAR